MGWIIELTVPTGELIEDALITPTKVYYLQRPAPGQKKLLYVYDKVDRTTKAAANGLAVASITATDTQIVVLLDGFVTTRPLPDQVGEIFQLENDDSINIKPDQDQFSHYLKAGVGIKSNATHVVACKRFNNNNQGNSRLLVWLRDQSSVDPELHGGNLALDLKRDETPSYRWTVTESAIFAISVDERTIVGARIPTDVNEAMKWSIKLEPTPMRLDAVFCTDNNRLFARSQQGQLLEYRRNAWEWTFGGSPVMHDRACCAAGSVHFVRSDDQSCYALRRDGEWQTIGEKITAPRIAADEEGVTTVSGVRGGRDIVSQDLDYLPTTSDSALVRRDAATEKHPNWLLTFKTQYTTWGTSNFSGLVNGAFVNASQTITCRFELYGEFKNGTTAYRPMYLDIDVDSVRYLYLYTTEDFNQFGIPDHWTLDWVEAWHLPTGRLLHFKVNGDVPRFDDRNSHWYVAEYHPWSEHKHVSGQSKAQVLFWDIKTPYVGHVALRIVENGTYISFWPANGKAYDQGRKSTYDRDVSLEGREPDVTIELKGLDLSSIAGWWAKFDVDARKYNLKGWSCSTIVWEAFKAGGVLKVDANILSKTGLSQALLRAGIFWPSDILVIAEELYKVGYYS